MKLAELPDSQLNLVRKPTLVKEQVEGVRFYHTHEAAMLVYQAGLGKTFTSLTAALHIKRRFSNVAIVVFCPARANKAFKKELAVLGETYKMWSAPSPVGPDTATTWVMNFSTMSNYRKEVEKLSKTHAIIGIVDEAHILGNAGTIQFKDMLYFRQFLKLRWLMTATPIMTVNNMKSIYNICEFMVPGFFGHWISFRNEYLHWDHEIMQVRGRIIQVERILGIKKPKELQEKLSKLILVRMLNYDIRYFYHKTPLKDKEVTYYRRAGRGLLENCTRTEFAQRLHDLQRVVDWSHESLPPDLSGKLSSKEVLFLNTLKGVMSDNSSVLVYCEYLDTADRLKAILTSVKAKGYLPISNIYSITGEDSKKSRDNIEDAMKPRSVVVCTQAGSESRNLQKANQIIIYNTPFSIGRFVQLVGRVARMDSEYPFMNIHFIEAEGTIDTYKRILIQDNAAMIKELFGELSNLPDVAKIDRTFQKDLRRKLLWGFSGFTK